jgi:hypothetical protein
MPKISTPTPIQIRKMVLQEAIDIYNECIVDITEDIEFHTEEYSDTYYGMMESITRLKGKRDKAIEEMESLNATK